MSTLVPHGETEGYDFRSRYLRASSRPPQACIEHQRPDEGAELGHLVVVSVGDGAADVASIDDPIGRRDRWELSFGEIETLNEHLADDLTPYHQDVILGPLVAEVERDLPSIYPSPT